MKKQVSLLIAAIFLVTAILAGCGSGNTAESTTTGSQAAATKGETIPETTAKPDPVTLTWATTIKPELLKDFSDGVTGVNPEITLNISYVPLENYAQIVRTQFAAGEGPDIAQSGLEEANAGYLLDLTGKPFLNNLADTAKFEATKEGKNWWLPVDTWVQGILYNKKMFADNGIQTPNTIKEFIEACNKLKAAGIKPYSLGNKEGFLAKAIIGTILTDAYAKNLKIESQVEAGQTTYAKEWKAGFEAWYELVKAGIVTTDSLGITYEESLNEFVSGKSAMIDSGSWEVTNIHTKNPELDFGIMGIPGPEGSKPWILGGNSVSMSINRQSKFIDSALKVLEYAATPDGDAKIITGTKGSPTIKGVTGGIDPSMQGVLPYVDASSVYCPWQNFQKIGVDAMVYTMFKGSQEVLLDKSIDQVLADLDNAVQKAIADAQKKQ